MKSLSPDAQPSNTAAAGSGHYDDDNADPAATLTIVRVPDDGPRRRLCKAINSQGEAEIADDLPYLCEFTETAVRTPEELLARLQELASDQTRCILRARVKPDVAQPCRRLLHPAGDDPATLDDVSRAWVLIDLDSVPCPADVDFRKEPARAAAHMRSTLPPEFHAPACVWRASSNAGLKDGIRLHLWFLLSAELDTPRLKHWLRDVACDKRVLGANQAHFTADPTFDGVPDPMTERLGMLDGTKRVLVPDEIANYVEPARPAASVYADDPFEAAAIANWEADHPCDWVVGSQRYPCSACGSTNSITLREDGRLNCFSSKHGVVAPNIGSWTGAVYVGTRLEFTERLTARERAPWLRRNSYWPESKLPAKFGARTLPATSDNSNAPTDAVSPTVSVVNAHPIMPGLRRRAESLLKQYKKAVKDTPAMLATAAEELGRYVPGGHLGRERVSQELVLACADSMHTPVVPADQAKRIVDEGLTRGEQRALHVFQHTDDAPPTDESGKIAKGIAGTMYYCGRQIVRNVVALDVRARRVVVLERPPWWENDKRPYPCFFTDAHLPRMAIFFANYFGYPYASEAYLSAALKSVAQDREWDPVEEYLEGLPLWEDTDDDAREFLELIPSILLGAEDTPGTRAVFKRWAIAAVRRTYEPGCQYREVLTLIGPQNIGKSKFLRLLCQDPRWFSDTVPADDHKNSRSVLDGKWIVEFAELDKHMKTDRAGAIKNFVSTQVDSYRRAYARLDEDCSRRCVFAATTNEAQVFKDPTGNTRFNVVHVTRVDAPSVEDFRDNIWAAAVHLYRKGEPSFLQDDERAEAERLQREAYDATSAEQALHDLWESPVPANVAPRMPTNALGFAFYPEQLDDQRRWRVLSHDQMTEHLKALGLLRGDSRKALAYVTRVLNLIGGRISSAVPDLTRKSGRARPDCPDFITKR